MLAALGVGKKEVNQARDTIHLDLTNPDNLKASGPRSLFNKEHGKLSLTFFLLLSCVVVVPNGTLLHAPEVVIGSFRQDDAEEGSRRTDEKKKSLSHF